jgi:TonB family protein
MSRRFHPNSFDLLGQAELYLYPVHLPGKLQPKLDIAWNSFHSNFFSGIPVFFRRAKIDKKAPPSTIFPDLNLERRIPVFAIFVAAVLHIAFFLVPWPDFAVTPPPNHAFDNTQLTWSGPINDLPLLQIPKNKSRSATKSPAQLDPAESTEAFHPRQRIYTDPVHPTHPQQTLINTAAPAEAPKILPDMPNVVQLAASQSPARPRMEINEKALAKLRPKTVKSAATTDAPTPDIANVEQHTAALNIAPSSNGPAKPKLEINPSSAPRAAQRAQEDDNSGAPEVPLGGSPNSSASSTLIALSTNPAPPAPVVPVPQGNLAARVAMSPEGKPGASGNSVNSTSGAGSGGSDPGNSGKGAGNSSVGVSISGGNPKANGNPSGMGGALNLGLPKSHAGYRRPDPNEAVEDPPERVGPPNFATLPPGAKPELIFSTKHIYTMNVNMPNLNSATGSWIIHFSELHLADAAHRSSNVTSPVPVHKVDPKYPQASALEHIQGEVILYGVIRRDGTVDGIQKVRGIDELLDANAIEAFGRWKFEPGTRDGEPVDLEAIVYIPFKAPPRQ